VWPKPEKQADICGHLQISAGIFRYLPVSSDICRCEPPFNKIMTCHKEYTESLPAPPGPMKPAGFSKAWPLANTGPNHLSEPFVQIISPLLRKRTERQRLSTPSAHLTNSPRQFSIFSIPYLPYPLHLPLRFPNAQYLHPPFIRLIAIIIS